MPTATTVGLADLLRGVLGNDADRLDQKALGRVRGAAIASARRELERQDQHRGQMTVDDFLGRRAGG